MNKFARRARARRRGFYYYEMEHYGPRITLRFIGDAPSWRTGTVVKHAHDWFHVMLVHGDGSVGGQYVHLRLMNSRRRYNAPKKQPAPLEGRETPHDHHHVPGRRLRS